MADEDVITEADLAEARERWADPSHESTVDELFSTPFYANGFRGDNPIAPAVDSFESAHWLEAIELEEAGPGVGTPFQGPSGKWFVKKDMGGGKTRTVPAKNPHAAPVKKKPEQQPKATPEQTVKAIDDLKASGKHTPDKVLKLLEHHTVEDLKAIKKALQIKGGKLKAELQAKIASGAPATIPDGLSPKKERPAERKTREATDNLQVLMADVKAGKIEPDKHGGYRDHIAAIIDGLPMTAKPKILKAIGAKSGGFSLGKDIDEHLVSIAPERPYKTKPREERDPNIPQPPKPLFTGVDSLGRHWTDGKLDPAKVTEAASPIGKKIQESKNLHETISRLSNIETPATKRIQEINDEIDFHSRGDSYGLGDSLFSAQRAFVAAKKPADRELTKKKWDDLQKRFDRANELRDEKRGLLDKVKNEQFQTVSEELRKGVKDPHKFTFTHDRDPDLTQLMGEKDPHALEKSKPIYKQAFEHLQGILHTGDGHVKPFQIYKDIGNSRAHCAWGYKINCGSGSSLNSGTAIHEAMHGVEINTPGVAEAVQQFRNHRIKSDEQGVNLKDKFGGDYDSSEVGYKDNFDQGMDQREAYYTGKYYSDNCTEILTMGVQRLYEDPQGFARGDPEFAAFIVGVLNGTIRGKQGA